MRPSHKLVAIVAPAVIGAALIGTSCGSSSKAVIPVPVSTTTARPNPERDALAFREVLGQVPYAAVAGAPTTNTCESGKLVTRGSATASSGSVVLPDRRKTVCYLLGPTLLTGHNISAASAVVSTTTAAWEVTLHFANDDFVTKVATPEVNKQVAIVLAGVVESVPTINAGITGRDLTIAGQFDEATARALARSLS
jgi:preprotein translocase subunit SecD